MMSCHVTRFELLAATSQCLQGPVPSLEIVSGLCETLCLELLPVHFLDMSVADLERERRTALRQAMYRSCRAKDEGKAALTKGCDAMGSQCLARPQSCETILTSKAPQVWLQVLVPRFCLAIGRCAAALPEEAQVARRGRSKAMASTGMFICAAAAALVLRTIYLFRLYRAEALQSAMPKDAMHSDP